MANLDKQELTRVARQLALPGYDLDEQERLADARVLVIGAGGLGCPLMQSLAAAGVGHVEVIDDDTVDISNIHRQILFGASDQGRLKVEVVAERLKALQPGIEVTARRGRLSADNAVALTRDVDLLIDGSDSFATKFLSADAAEITGTPLVWGTVLRFDGQAALWHSGPTERGVGLRDLFPEQPDASAAPDCATAGVLGVTTAVIGNLMATEAIKYLAGIGESVPGRVMAYDALRGSLRSFTVRADPAREPVTALQETYADVCGAPDPGPGPEELVAAAERGEALALDIREPHEKLLADLPESTNPRRLPLSEISSPADVEAALDGAGRVVVYCASGRRSSNFVEDYGELARSVGAELVNFPGGANGWVKEHG
ncbi:ThiF family adenylyltransferase [Corynebacterium otitidis]